MDSSNSHYLILSKLPIALDARITPNSLVSTFHIFKKGTQKNYIMIFNQLIQLNITEVSSSPLVSFKKDPIKRTYQDIFNIKHFIDSSDFGRKFKDKSVSRDLLNKIFIMCAIEMKYSSLHSDEILFRIGDPGKDFYLILSGAVDVLKPEPKETSMTGFEYFAHLMQLKRTNEVYVYNRTIKENAPSFFIEDIDKDIINQITFINLLIEVTERRRFYSIAEIIDLCLIDLTNIPKLNLPLLEEQQGNSESIAIIKDHFSLSDANLLRKYNKIFSHNEKKEVTVFEYKSLVSLGRGYDFGDSALDKTIERNSTIKSIGHTDLAVLDGAMYLQAISKEKMLLTNKEVNFLHKNFFFSMPYRAFERKYYNLFVIEEKLKGDFLCKEDEAVTKLFFIRKGTVGLFTNKSILETHELLNQLQSKKPEIKGEVSYFTAKNNISDMKKQLNEKRLRRVFSFDMNEIIGLESYVFSMPYLVSAKVTSENATVFKIDIRHFRDLFYEQRIKENLETFATNKLKILYRRLYEMNKIIIKKIDDKKASDNVNGEIKDKVTLKLRKRNSSSLSCLNLNQTTSAMKKDLIVFQTRKSLHGKISKSITSRSTLCSKTEKSKSIIEKRKNFSEGMSYESLFLNIIKRDIEEDKKLGISMSKDVIPISDTKPYGMGYLSKSTRSCNVITDKHLEQKKIKSLLQEKSRSTKRDILITQLQPSQSHIELKLTGDTTYSIYHSKAKKYINPSIQEKNSKYAIFNQYQSNIQPNPSELTTKKTSSSPWKEIQFDGSYLFPKRKTLSKINFKKAIEYQTHKNNIKSQINSSWKLNL